MDEDRCEMVEHREPTDPSEAMQFVKAALHVRLREPEMRRQVALAISHKRFAESIGCFSPAGEIGECASDDCYCLRQCEREADAALAVITEKLT